jgi:hypothetical protein
MGFIRMAKVDGRVQLMLVALLTAVGCGGDDGASADDISTTSAGGQGPGGQGQGGQGGQGQALRTVGGTLVGLDGGTLTLQNNGGDDLVLDADGPFVFPTGLADGATYQVTPTAQPDDPAQHCVVSYGAGSVDGEDVDTVTVVCLAGVEPLYPASGANWNDYVTHDGATRIGASDAPCDPLVAAGYGACIHGGAMRVIEVPGLGSCDDVVVSDTEGAFTWLCDDTGDEVRAVTTGLAEGTRLSDLIDFDAVSWRPLGVVIERAGVQHAASLETVWWQNPVEATGGGSLGADGTIYVVTATDSSYFFVSAPRVALVVEPGVELIGDATFHATASGDGPIPPPAPPTSGVHTLNGPVDFVWIEGRVAGTLVSLETHHSVIHGLSVQNGGFGLRDASDNLVSDVMVAGGAGMGVTRGLRNLFVDTRVTGRVGAASASAGLTLGNLSPSEGGANVLARTWVTSSTAGVLVDDSSFNALFGLTVAHVAESGVELTTAVIDTTMSGVAALNGASGLTLAGDFTKIVDVAAANNGVGIDSSNGAIFDGMVKVGDNQDDCVAAGPHAGIDTDCNPLGPSDFGTAHFGVEVHASFAGLVGDGGIDADGDDVNPNDDATPGVAEAASISDWLSFENGFRAWTIEAISFPHPDQRGPCQAASCRIFDFRLALGDLGDANGGGTGVAGPALLDVAGPPSGDDTLVHWVSTTATSQAECDAFFPGSTFFDNPDSCRVLILRRAYELLGDAEGNDNLLCESNETCVFTPNIGAYQGHGALVPVTGFVDGALSGIRLLRYEENGVM